jgi:rare lipoprotein A
MIVKIGLLAFTALVLTACSTTAQRPVESRTTPPAPIEDHTLAPAAKPVPGSGGYLAGDGPGDNPPANMDEIPDAVPKNEPLHRYANRPYVALAKTYTPLSAPGNFKQRGIASWYGKKFHDHRTSSGEKYDMYAMTAAHPILPIPSYARVTNVATNKSVIVRINDRGPFMHSRAIDLSYTAAHKLGLSNNGSSTVEIESIVADNYSPNTYAIAKAESVQSAPLDKVDEMTATRPSGARVASSGNAFLQLGAFSTRAAAEKFQSEMRNKLGSIGKQLVLFTQDNKIRVHVGPYANQVEARNSRESFRDKLGFMPVVSMH